MKYCCAKAASSDSGPKSSDTASAEEKVIAGVPLGRSALFVKSMPFVSRSLPPPAMTRELMETMCFAPMLILIFPHRSGGNLTSTLTTFTAAEENPEASKVIMCV